MNSVSVPCHIAVIAGGASRRMGRDKASITADGSTWLQRVVRRALDTGAPVVVAGRTEPEDWSLQGVRFVVDDQPGLGPIGGIRTALRHCGSGVLAVACDQPLLTTEAMLWLLTQREEEEVVDGIIVTHGDGIEPLFSIYEQSVLRLIDEGLEAGERSLREMIRAGRFRYSELPPELVPALVNVNTPEELAELDAMRGDGDRSGE